MLEQPECCYLWLFLVTWYFYTQSVFCRQDILHSHSCLPQSTYWLAWFRYISIFIASDLWHFALINSEGAIFLHFLPYANFRGVAAWHVQLVPKEETGMGLVLNTRLNEYFVGTTTERVRSANFKVSVKKFYYQAAKGFCEGYKKTFHQIKNFACAQFSYFKCGKQNLDPMQNVKR